MERVGASIDSLNDLARRRIEHGLSCFAFMERFDRSGPQFAAVCVDLGLTARGATLQAARAELEGVIVTFLRLADERGTLASVLSRPANRECLRLRVRVERADSIAKAILPLLKFVAHVAVLFRAPSEKYVEPIRACGSMVPV